MNSADLSLIDNCDHTRREAATQLDDGIADTFVSDGTGETRFFVAALKALALSSGKEVPQ